MTHSLPSNIDFDALPAIDPAAFLPRTDPCQIRVAEQVKLESLRQIVAGQTAPAPSAGRGVSETPAEFSEGLQDGYALGFVTREAADLNRLEKGLATRADHKAKAVPLCVAVFEGKRAFLSLAAVTCIAKKWRAVEGAMLMAEVRDGNI